MRRTPMMILVFGAGVLAGCAGSSTTKVGSAGKAPAAHGNGPIAYERFAGASSDRHSSQIFVRMPAGAVQQLTHVAGGAYNPAWSPDGAHIAFDRAAAGQRHELYTMNADGSDARAITDGCSSTGHCASDTSPAYSPDGRQLSFMRVQGPIVGRSDPGGGENIDIAAGVDLMVVAANGGAPKSIAHWGTDPQPAAADAGGPVTPLAAAARWSPDGRSLVLPLSTLKSPNKHTIDATALFIIGAAGGPQRRITPWALGASNGDWSRDGRLILFNTAGGHSPSIYLARPDGGRLTRVITGGRAPGEIGDTQDPVWSPDGRQIALTTEPSGCGSLHVGRGCKNYVYSDDVFVMDPDATHVRDLTPTAKYEARPAWGRARD